MHTHQIRMKSRMGDIWHQSLSDCMSNKPEKLFVVITSDHDLILGDNGIDADEQSKWDQLLQVSIAQGFAVAVPDDHNLNGTADLIQKQYPDVWVYVIRDTETWESILNNTPTNLLHDHTSQFTTSNGQPYTLAVGRISGIWHVQRNDSLYQTNFVDIPRSQVELHIEKIETAYQCGMVESDIDLRSYQLGYSAEIDPQPKNLHAGAINRVQMIINLIEQGQFHEALFQSVDFRNELDTDALVVSSRSHTTLTKHHQLNTVNNAWAKLPHEKRTNGDKP